MIYLVSYDLNKPGQDYQALIDAIQTYDGYCKALWSQWFIYSNESAKDIYEHLRAYIDDNDRLLVCEITENQKGWLSKEVVAWLKMHF